MNLFLGHTTVCLYWLNATQEQLDRAMPTNALPSTLSARTAKAARLMAEGTAMAGKTLHVDVCNAGARSDTDVIFHTGKHLPGDYRKTNRDVYIASPELTFIQMAAFLSLHELVLLGNEFCSEYVRDEFSPTGLAHRASLTTPEALRRRIDCAGPFTGKQKAQRALRFITPCAASPKEVEWAARLALSNQYGGYGLPAFTCNYAIEIPKSMRHLTDKSKFKADFCWPSKKVVLEYDSDLHTGSAKIAEDTMRRNFLATKGFTVIGITRIQNNSEREMDRIAEEIKRALGMRLDIRCKNYWKQKEALATTCRRWTHLKPEEYFENR